MVLATKWADGEDSVRGTRPVPSYENHKGGSRDRRDSYRDDRRRKRATVDLQSETQVVPHKSGSPASDSRHSPWLSSLHRTDSALGHHLGDKTPGRHHFDAAVVSAPDISADGLRQPTCHVSAERAACGRHHLCPGWHDCGRHWLCRHFSFQRMPDHGFPAACLCRNSRYLRACPIAVSQRQAMTPAHPIFRRHHRRNELPVTLLHLDLP